MPNLKPIGGTIESQDLNDNFSVLDEQLAHTATKINFIINIDQFEHLKIAIANGYDWTQAFKEALTVVKNQGGGIVFLPSRDYYVSDTSLISSNTTLRGESKFNTRILNVDGTVMLNKPLVASENYNKNAKNDNIRLENLTFRSSGERTAFTVTLNNTVAVVTDDCVFDGAGGSSVNSKHGLEVARAGGFTGSLYMARVNNCRFTRSVCKVNVTDSYVRGNELWGDQRYCALDLTDASNSMIISNQLVGGETFGAIYSATKLIGMKISNNYFDGSWYTIDTKWGTYFAGGLEKSVITSNNFWQQKSGGIYAEFMVACTVANNTFDECDFYERQLPDIQLGNGASFSNSITGNTHFRHQRITDDRTSTQERDVAKAPPVYDLSNQDNFNPTTVANNTLYYSQYYAKANYRNGKFSVENNNSGRFSLSNYDKVKQTAQKDKDLFINKTPSRHNNLSTLLEMYDERIAQWLRIDNIRTFIANNTGSPLNLNDVNYDANIYISNTAGVTNLPDSNLIGAESFMICRQITTNFAMQILFGANFSTGHFSVQYRVLSNGTWRNWLKLQSQ